MSHSQQIAVMVPFLGIVLWEGLILVIAMWVRPSWYVLRGSQLRHCTAPHTRQRDSSGRGRY